MSSPLCTKTLWSWQKCDIPSSFTAQMTFLLGYICLERASFSTPVESWMQLCPEPVVTGWLRAAWRWDYLPGGGGGSEASVTPGCYWYRCLLVYHSFWQTQESKHIMTESEANGRTQKGRQDIKENPENWNRRGNIHMERGIIKKRTKKRESR